MSHRGGYGSKLLFLRHGIHKATEAAGEATGATEEATGAAVGVTTATEVRGATEEADKTGTKGPEETTTAEVMEETTGTRAARPRAGGRAWPSTEAARTGRTPHSRWAEATGTAKSEVIELATTPEAEGAAPS